MNLQIPVPVVTDLAENSFMTRRSVYRVAFLLGVGGAAYLAYTIYQHKFRRGGRRPPEILGKDGKSVRISKIVEISDGGVSTSNNLESPTASSVTTDLTRQNVKIILHEAPRGYFTPCITPFPLKLETYLRVTNIGYEVDFTTSPGDDKNTPWITINGEEFSETHSCITKLNELLHLNLDADATESRKCASRLVGIMLENHIYWGIALWRWVFDEGRSLPLIQPLVSLSAIADVSAAVSRAAWCHGLGRLSPELVNEQILKDLGDLSAALGKHSYFLGESPGEVDCGAFAMLSQMLWSMPGSPFEPAVKQYRNLIEFVLRMRDNFWPDWEKQLQIPEARDNLDELELGMLPGAEFLNARQLYAESSQWDSKTTSTVTLTDFRTTTVGDKLSKQVLSSTTMTSNLNLPTAQSSVIETGEDSLVTDNKDNQFKMAISDISLGQSLSRKSIAFGDSGSVASGDALSQNLSSNRQEVFVATAAVAQVMASAPFISNEKLTSQSQEPQNQQHFLVENMNSKPFDQGRQLPQSQQQFGNDQMGNMRNVLMGMHPMDCTCANCQLGAGTLQGILSRNISDIPYSYPPQQQQPNFCEPYGQQQPTQYRSAEFHSDLSQGSFVPQQTIPTTMYPTQYTNINNKLDNFGYSSAAGQLYQNLGLQHIAPLIVNPQFYPQHQQMIQQQQQQLFHQQQQQFLNRDPF